MRQPSAVAGSGPAGGDPHGFGSGAFGSVGVTGSDTDHTTRSRRFVAAEVGSSLMNGAITSIHSPWWAARSGCRISPVPNPPDESSFQHTTRASWGRAIWT